MMSIPKKISRFFTVKKIVLFEIDFRIWKGKIIAASKIQSNLQNLYNEYGINRMLLECSNLKKLIEKSAQIVMIWNDDSDTH